MKTRLLIAVGMLLLLGLTFTVAGADSGPHGGYTPTTDACAGCHRVHTATGGKLLLSPVPNLCYTCHGTTATGADTNVVDGIYLERDAFAESPAEGVAGQGLKGGGFVNAIIDTDRDGTAVSTAVTSNHLADGSMGTAWGNGAIGSGPGLAIELSCISCHDPHGGDTYRILRTIPNESGAGSPVTVTDEVDKIYTVTDPQNDYMVEDYGSLATSLASWCSQCHTRYLAGSGSGHTDSGDDIFTYRHTTTNISCVKCHVAHGSTASMGFFSGSVNWPDDTTTPDGDARSSLLRMDNRGVCAYCHLGDDGTISGGACDTCHDSPPETGAHLTHSGPDSVGYGLTGSFAAGADYQYGCGECHPTNDTRHMDGTVDVDLSPGTAPPGSIKSQNGSAAAFAGGSCGDVYCHSGIDVTSGPVGLPLTIASGDEYIFDEHGNLTYAPYTVTETHLYRTTPAWEGGAVTTCTACHDFPLTTSYPSLEAGVGNTHQWIDDSNYGNLHAWNMSYDPLSCRTCHYGEITEENTWSRDADDVTFYDPVPLADVAVHANGQRDVVFDTVNDIVYTSSSDTTVYQLDDAAYIPGEKACTNVGCHKLQTYVEWGTPYRWDTNECDLCHRYALPPPPSPRGLLSLENNNTAQSGFDHETIDLTDKTCTSCHERSHGD